MFRIASAKICAAVLATLGGVGYSPTANAEQAATKVQIYSDGISCKGCAQKVAAELYTLPGVSNVETDLATHTAVVTFTPSSKTTLANLWQAAEGHGKTSKLVTPQATYTLQRPDQLKLAEPLAPGRYWIVAKGLTTNEAAQKIAKQLQSVRGVKTVQADIASRTLFVESSSESLLPWDLVSAVEQAGDLLLSITGPHGVLNIEYRQDAQARATSVSSVQKSGAVR